jgi:hypothetical protein
LRKILYNDETPVVTVDVLISVLLALAFICLLSIVTVAVIVRMLYKRIRRSRALTGAALRTRARFSWGPREKVLKLRLQLMDILDSGQAAVDLTLRSDGPRGELPRLFRRVQSEGAALESQLRLMESETDPAALADEVLMASRRVDEIAGVVRQLRAVVATGLGDLTDDTLTALRSDVDREVAALHAGVQELHTLNGNDGLSASRLLPSPDRLNRRNAS